MRKVEPARKSVHTGWQPTAGGTKDGRRSSSSINDRDVCVPALEVTGVRVGLHAANGHTEGQLLSHKTRHCA